ncbi:MAG: aminotransferase class IV [Methylovirgula sp.]
MFWFDGTLHETSIAPVDLTDRGLTLGDGLFDTSLARNGRVFRRKAHLDRFAANAEVLAIPFDLAAATQALDALAAAIGDGIVRLTLTRGGGARGLGLPDNPKPFLFGAASSSSPGTSFPVLALATSPIRRNETSPVARLKALPYLDAILGLREATERGADDVLFENMAGHIACVSVGNIFASFGPHLVTPPLADGVLAGTIRAYILAKAGALGFAVEERSMTRAEFLRADAIFATNSIKLLAPCRAVDDVSFASAEHEGIRRLQAMLREAIVVECGRA